MADLTSIENQLVELYRQKVLEVGAFRTGALYDSIEVVATISPTAGPSVEVLGIEYLPFVDEGTIYIDPRHITDKWLRDPKFERLFQELADIWVDELFPDETV